MHCCGFSAFSQHIPSVSERRILLIIPEFENLFYNLSDFFNHSNLAWRLLTHLCVVWQTKNAYLLSLTWSLSWLLSVNVVLVCVWTYWVAVMRIKSDYVTVSQTAQNHLLQFHIHSRNWSSFYGFTYMGTKEKKYIHTHGLFKLPNLNVLQSFKLHSLHYIVNMTKTDLLCMPLILADWGGCLLNADFRGWVKYTNMNAHSRGTQENHSRDEKTKTCVRKGGMRKRRGWTSCSSELRSILCTRDIVRLMTFFICHPLSPTQCILSKKAKYIHIYIYMYAMDKKILNKRADLNEEIPTSSLHTPWQSFSYGA